MVDQKTRELLEMALFVDGSFEQQWMEIRQEYDALGFRDDITDEEMIGEFKYVAQQLRKYKFSKQDQVLGADSLEDMLAVVDDLLGKAPEYGGTRKEIVYNFLRDHWLILLHNFIVRLMGGDMYESDVYEEGTDE